MSTPSALDADTPRPVVLVTGAARRLGREIALHLAREGWDVAVHGRGPTPEAESTAAELRAHGARVAVLAADLADEAACEALLPAAVSALGRVDAVVNNASHFEYDSIATVTHASLDTHWKANTAPALILARSLHTHLGARGARGCVVNVLDQKLWNPNPDYLSYTLSKAALECATSLLAQALAPVLRVVGVAPGLTLGSALIDAEQLAALQAATPLGRGTSVVDLVKTVHFLLDSGSITGHTVLVDAGSHLVRADRDFPFQSKEKR